MDFEKMRRFGELQSEVFEQTGGEMPLLTLYSAEDGVAVHNPFLDVTGREAVDPVAAYGEAALSAWEKNIAGIEQEMGCSVEEMEAYQLRNYLGGKFYQGKEVQPEWMEALTCEEMMFEKSEEVLVVDDTLSFYVPLFDGFEKVMPEAALALVTPIDEDKQLNLYAVYDIANEMVSLRGICNEKEFEAELTERAGAFLKEKIGAYVELLEGKDLKTVAEEMVDEEILAVLKETVENEWYEKPDENGYYNVEIPADYWENNEFLLKDAYNNRESADFKFTLINAISEAYMDTRMEYENELLEKAGFESGHPFYDRAQEIQQEYICFEPDYDHFLNDDIKLNLLLGTDFERNSDFIDIHENLARQIDKEAFAEMQEDVKKYGTVIEQPDNALVWLMKQQGYTMEDLKQVKEEYDTFLEKAPEGNGYNQTYDEFRKTHSPFLTSICQELENQSYAMGCLTVLMKSTLNEMAEILEKDTDTGERVSKEIVLPKDTMVGIFNPWNGSGSVLEIELEKELVLPTELIWDMQLEGVKPEWTYTVDDVYGLVGDAWKECKEVRGVEPEGKEKEVEKVDSLADKIAQAKEQVQKQGQSKEGPAIEKER